MGMTHGPSLVSGYGVPSPRPDDLFIARSCPGIDQCLLPPDCSSLTCPRLNASPFDGPLGLRLIHRGPVRRMRYIFFCAAPLYLIHERTCCSEQRAPAYAIVEGMNVRGTRVGNYLPRWNAAPSQELLSSGPMASRTFISQF
jgi:hypothetical protein